MIKRTEVAGNSVPKSATVSGRPKLTTPSPDLDQRKPMQPRSQASLDRMLSTALDLMMERQSEEFTLQEISVLGKVSIGSIYHRFQSKDELVRAVIGRALGALADEEVRTFDTMLESSKTLDEYIPAYVRAFGENLRRNSLMLRLAMRRAATDPEVSRSGEAHEMEAADRFSNTVLRYEGEMAGDIDTRIKVAFQLIFATIARHLSLDSHDPYSARMDWDILLKELSRMVTAYLKAPE